MEDYYLLDEDMGTEEILMMSTIVNRTIQSGYSELMGMFPPSKKDAVKLTAEQQQALLPGGVSAPPFKIRTNQK